MLLFGNATDSLQWRPSYRSVDALMKACETKEDPFETRKATYTPEMDKIAADLTKWRKERLPPPHALQSDFDHAAVTGTFYILFLSKIFC